jgi:2-hydroxychromene-2-carboxylate isomerase
MAPPITFYFDIGSPYAYLAAERLDTVLPDGVVWQPVLLGGLFRLTARGTWALGDYRRRQAGMAEIERRAQGYGLAPMRWPDPWPTDYLYAMRATTHAFAIGRGRAFAMRAFRDAFQRGHGMEIHARVLDAGEAVGIARDELVATTQDPAVKRALRDATDAAYERGVIGVPTVAVGDALFWGDDRLEDAAAHLCTVADPRTVTPSHLQ